MTEVSTDIQKAARVAEQAAYAAGTHLQATRSRLSAILITQEAPSEVVAQIKREVMDLIEEVVSKAFPAHRFADTVLDTREPHWVVNPLDGTSNYLRGYPQYAVTLALVEAAEPQVGIVYDPCRNEFFGAIRGLGAVLNGERIHCAPPRPPLEALAATVFPRPGSLHMPVYMTELGRVLRAFGGVRRSGSAALELACVAAGRLDAFWQHELEPNKTAAAIVLLREAGALFHARDGLPLLWSRSVLACAPRLFEPFLSLLAES